MSDISISGMSRPGGGGQSRHPLQECEEEAFQQLSAEIVRLADAWDAVRTAHAKLQTLDLSCDDGLLDQQDEARRATEALLTALDDLLRCSHSQLPRVHSLRGKAYGVMQVFETARRRAQEQARVAAGRMAKEQALAEQMQREADLLARWRGLPSRP